MSSAAALVARGIAPIKPEYLRAAPEVEVGGVREAAVEAPSRRQATQNWKAARATQLCQAFTQGRCLFGAGCRFSHDAASFLASKPPDLPGPCPFASQPACPYGLACRYARAHLPAEPAVLAGVDVAPAAADDEPHEPQGEALPLPRVERVQAELNGLTGALQVALRKNQRLFPAADEQLRTLGCKISFKPARQPAAQAAQEAPCEAEERSVKRARVEECVQGSGARLRPSELKLVDFRGKTYLAPLTTVGNLPFRRLCKALGADITCSEMSLATNLLQGQPSEWALLRRHPCEDIFGVQLCGGYPDAVARTCELLSDENVSCSFVDLNCGCPIDLVCDKGAGSALLTKPQRMEAIVRAAAPLLHVPLTLKTRTGYSDEADARSAHALAPRMADWGVTALTLHGRTRAQRYSRTADWDYVRRTSDALEPHSPMQLIGNGDVASWTEYEQHVNDHGVHTCMLARGALIKPWLFTEIRERRHWDVSACERLEFLKTFASHGLEHWGSDSRGVESTRRFLLEWLSFLHRYIPVGLLDVLPQQLTWRPQPFVGRSELETLFASPAPADWVRITAMLLGPPPPGFVFKPKHKSSSYANTESGAALYETETNG